MAGIPASRYDRVAMSLHWVVAALMIFMLFFGPQLMKTKGLTSALIPSLHVGIGLTIMVLSLVRLAWRWFKPAPPLPSSMMTWEVALAKISHALFYVLLIGIPLTGWFALHNWLPHHQLLADQLIFNSLPVPDGSSLNIRFGYWHALGRKAGVILLGLHVLAALKHQFVNRDGLMRRMLPV